MASPWGSDDGVGRPYSSTCPSGVIRPMQLAAHSVNQHPPPAGSAMIACGRADRFGSGYSVRCPSGVMRPSWPAPISVNQGVVGAERQPPIRRHRPAAGTAYLAVRAYPAVPSAWSGSSTAHRHRERPWTPSSRRRHRDLLTCRRPRSVRSGRPSRVPRASPPPSTPAPAVTPPLSPPSSPLLPPPHTGPPVRPSPGQRHLPESGQPQPRAQPTPGLATAPRGALASMPLPPASASLRPAQKPLVPGSFPADNEP